MRTSYRYDGKCPYSAADLCYIDHFLDYDFEGNAVEQVIADGIATYENSALTFTATGVQIRFVEA